MKANLVKYYNLIVRLIIILGTITFLSYQIFVTKDFAGLFKEAPGLISGLTFFLLALCVLLLMPVNWGLESYKWRYLVAKSENVSFGLANKAVYAGISISSLSPNRIGEFFGRVFVLKRTSFWRGVTMTVLGSLAQTYVTLFFGINAIAYFLYPYMMDKGILNPAQFKFLYGLLLLGFVSMLVVFLRISRLGFIWKRLSVKYRIALNILHTYKAYELTKVVLISTIRYFVFSLQYYVLLRALQVEIDFVAGMGLISIIFFFNTVRPSVALLEIGVRYAIAYQVFDIYYTYVSQDIYFTESQLLLASSILWLVNIVIPALIGLFFVPGLKFFRSNSKQASL